MLCILDVGTVPTLCIVNVGTVPTLCILNVETVPTFSHSHKKIFKNKTWSKVSNFSISRNTQEKLK